MLHCKLLLFVACITTSRATNFPVAKSRNSIYFLQQGNLLRAEVVIRTTNNHNLQCNIVVRQVAKKNVASPYYLALTDLLCFLDCLSLLSFRFAGFFSMWPSTSSALRNVTGTLRYFHFFVVPLSKK